MLTRIYLDEYVNYYYPADFLSKIIELLTQWRNQMVVPVNPFSPPPPPVFFSLPQLKALGEHV